MAMLGIERVSYVALRIGNIMFSIPEEFLRAKSVIDIDAFISYPDKSIENATYQFQVDWIKMRNNQFEEFHSTPDYASIAEERVYVFIQNQKLSIKVYDYENLIVDKEYHTDIYLYDFLEALGIDYMLLEKEKDS